MGMKVNGTSGLTFPDTTTLASAGQASVRAWVNFNGTGTVAIRASFNVTSITDNGTGDYTVNFTTAMPDENYAIAFAGSRQDGNNSAVPQIVYSGGAPLLMSTTAFRLSNAFPGSDTREDSFQINVAIFR
jgi:hypothetical protein